MKSGIAWESVNVYNGIKERAREHKAHRRGFGGRWTVRQLQAGIWPAERRQPMKLSLVERETILLYNQAEPMAEVYTHDPRLMEKLGYIVDESQVQGTFGFGKVYKAFKVGNS